MTKGVDVHTLRRPGVSVAGLLMHVGLALALLLLGLPGGRLTATSSATQEMKFLGHLPIPSDWDGDQPTMLQVEAGKRVVSLYSSRVTQTEHLLEYDLRSALPKISRNADLGSTFIKPFPSPYINVLDTKRNRLLMLVAKNFVGSNVDVVDLNTLRSAGTWDLFQRVPGFVGWGLTYSAEDDLVYIVGEPVASGSGLAQHGPLFPKPPVPGMLIALKPDTGALVWSVPLANCAVLNTYSIGAVVARSKVHRAVYIPCARSSPYTNAAGVQRVWIDPAASITAAPTFRQEFFPISGVWVSPLGLLQGVAAFDPETDRVVMQSLSVSTPGAWIFDGRISGWVGFVATPRPYDAIGVNAGNGHYYASASAEPVLVSPIRGTPVPQGTTYDHVRVGSVGSFIYTDAKSNRLFILEQVTRERQRYAVYDDHTPDELPLDPTDFDALTEDVDEGPSTAATFAGGVRGFGSRVSMVGGTGAIWERVRQFVPFAQLGGYPFTGVSPGDRTLTFANASSIDLRNPGAAAAAQALSPDTNTDEDHRTRQLEIAEVCQMLEERVRTQGNETGATQIHDACERRPLGTPTPGQSPPPAGDQQLRAQCVAVQTALKAQGASELATQLEVMCQTAGVNAALATAAESARWPWPALGCLDGGGSKSEQQASGPNGQGSAEVLCNLDGSIASARATAPGVKLKAGDLTLSIGSSTIVAESIRDPAAGMITKVTAEARAIEIIVPGSGSLSIGVARSVASAAAHGQSGTADASLARRLERVVVRDAQNRVVRSVNECDLQANGCATVLALAGSLLAPRVRLYEPAFALRETKKGAFAGVQKAEAEYLNALNTQNDNSRVVPALELIFYDDTAEKSRFVVQLAGAQVSSIYYITTIEEPLSEGETTTVVETVQVPVEVPGPPGPPQVITRIVQRPGSPGAIENTFAVLVRSPKEAVHLAAIWLLFGLAVLSLVRRRTLRRAVRPTD